MFAEESAILLSKRSAEILGGLSLDVATALLTAVGSCGCAPAVGGFDTVQEPAGAFLRRNDGGCLVIRRQCDAENNVSDGSAAAHGWVSILRRVRRGAESLG